MEFKCDIVIILYLAGTPQMAIVRAPQHLNVNKSFPSPIIARYRGTDSVVSRPKIAREQIGNNTRNDPKNKGQIRSKFMPQW